jgi:hypothetical protein
MNMPEVLPTRYCPIFESLIDSSLWGEEYPVRLTFIALLALKGMDDIVRFNAYNIAQRARMEEGEVLKALKVLSSPDKKRIEPQPYEGRRIEAVEGGWLVLNGAYYRNQVKRINILASKAQWARKNRAKSKTMRKNGKPDGNGSVPGYAAWKRTDELGDQAKADSIVTESLPPQCQ